MSGNYLDNQGKRLINHSAPENTYGDYHNYPIVPHLTFFSTTLWSRCAIFREKCWQGIGHKRKALRCGESPQRICKYFLEFQRKVVPIPQQRGRASVILALRCKPTTQDNLLGFPSLRRSFYAEVASCRIFKQNWSRLSFP